MSTWYATWFDSKYYHLLYKHRSNSEAQFFIDNLLGFLEPNDGAKMMDLACGKGRHSVYLANKGYKVVGTDLSKESIDFASQFETEQLNFFVHDMREVFPSQPYDFIFNFFTSFGYFETDEEHVDVLREVKAGLSPNGTFVMDFLNIDKVLSGLVKKETKKVGDIEFQIKRKFDQGKIVKSIAFHAEGEDFYFEEKVRGFNLSEMENLYKKAGLQIEKTFGNYSLEPHSIASDRLIIIAKKAE